MDRCFSEIHSGNGNEHLTPVSPATSIMPKQTLMHQRIQRCATRKTSTPQLVMLACRKIGIDGVAYFSTRVSDAAFARCATNLALFVEYDDMYSSLIRHMKIGTPTNYALCKQLLPSAKEADYTLASIEHPYITNIGKCEDQHPYRETDFYEFDKYLFKRRSNSQNKINKETAPCSFPIV